MKRVIITIVVLGAAIAGIMYKLKSNKEHNEAQTAEVAKKNDAISVRIDTASLKEMDISYLANGTFNPKQESVVAAEVAGRVIKVLVSEGSRVGAGQTLAIVRGDKLDVSVTNSQAVYNNALAEVQRFESAYATGGVTKQQVDQMKLQLENAKNNLKSAQLNAGDVAIKTGISGIVNAKKIENGTYLALGAAAFEIVNVSALKLRVNVDEKNVALLKVGQEVEVTVSVISNKTFKGKITFIAPKSDGSLNFPVEIEVNNANNELRAGMYGSAIFGNGVKASSLVVPRTAFVGSVSDNKIYVVKDGKAVETQVVSGRSFGDYIEVVSGLNNGDVVVVSGQVNLFNNTPVNIIK